MVPVLCLIVFGCLDVVAYFRNMSALEKTATAIGEVVSRCNQLTTQDISNYAVEAQEMVGGPPFAPLIDITATGGAFIISAIGNNSGSSTTIVWQKKVSSAAVPYASKIGSVGGAPASIGTFAVPQGQVLITVELYNAFSLWAIGTPLLAPSTSTTMYTVGLFLARSANPEQLETLTTSSTAACGT